MVPEAAAQLECKKGLVSPLPQLSPQYVRSFPPVPVTRFKKEILRQIRTTASMSVLELDSLGQLSGANLAFRRRLVSVVEQFPKDPHLETPMALGLSCHADEEYDRALQFYNEAERRIREDRKLDASSPPWSEQIQRIERKKCLAAKKQTTVTG